MSVIVCYDCYIASYCLLEVCYDIAKATGNNKPASLLFPMALANGSVHDRLMPGNYVRKLKLNCE